MLNAKTDSLVTRRDTESRRRPTLVVVRARGAHRAAAQEVLGGMVKPIQFALRQRPGMFGAHHFDRAVKGSATSNTIALDTHADELRDLIAHGLPAEHATDSIRYLGQVVREALAEREGRRAPCRERMLTALLAHHQADTREDLSEPAVLLHAGNKAALLRHIEDVREEMRRAEVYLDEACALYDALPDAPTPPTAA